MQETVQRSERCDQCIYQVYDSHEQCDTKSATENCIRSEITRHCGFTSVSHLLSVERLSGECKTVSEQSRFCLLQQVTKLPEEHHQWFSL